MASTFGTTQYNAQASSVQPRGSSPRGGNAQSGGAAVAIGQTLGNLAQSIVGGMKNERLNKKSLELSDKMLEMATAGKSRTERDLYLKGVYQDYTKEYSAADAAALKQSIVRQETEQKITSAGTQTINKHDESEMHFQAKQIKMAEFEADYPNLTKHGGAVADGFLGETGVMPTFLKNMHTEGAKHSSAVEDMYDTYEVMDKSGALSNHQAMSDLQTTNKGTYLTNTTAIINKALDLQAMSRLEEGQTGYSVSKIMQVTQAVGIDLKEQFTTAGLDTLTGMTQADYNTYVDNQIAGVRDIAKVAFDGGDVKQDILNATLYVQHQEAIDTAMSNELIKGTFGTSKTYLEAVSKMLPAIATMGVTATEEFDNVNLRMIDEAKNSTFSTQYKALTADLDKGSNGPNITNMSRTLESLAKNQVAAMLRPKEYKAAMDDLIGRFESQLSASDFKTKGAYELYTSRLQGFKDIVSELHGLSGELDLSGKKADNIVNKNRG